MISTGLLEHAYLPSAGALPACPADCGIIVSRHLYDEQERSQRQPSPKQTVQVHQSQGDQSLAMQARPCPRVCDGRSISSKATPHSAIGTRKALELLCKVDATPSLLEPYAFRTFPFRKNVNNSNSR